MALLCSSPPPYSHTTCRELGRGGGPQLGTVAGDREMSGIPSGNIGIPVKLLHESEGHTVSVELKTGEVYRGHLVESEDNMNMQLSNVTMTARDGRVSNIEQCFIRGSKVRFMVSMFGIII